MAVINPETLREDLEIEAAMNSAPYIGLSDSQIREAVICACKNWLHYRPHEYPLWKKGCEAHRQLQSNRAGRTKEGNHVVGFMPTYVMIQLNKFFNDHEWMRHNPRAIGILFDVLEEGRTSYLEGRGRGGASGRMTLDAADLT